LKITFNKTAAMSIIVEWAFVELTRH